MKVTEDLLKEKLEQLGQQLFASEENAVLSSKAEQFVSVMTGFVSPILEENAALSSKIGQLQNSVEQMKSEIERLKGLLKYYANPNTPPSANSLEWKEEKRQKKKQDRETPSRKRGGQTGHKGVSRRRSPERTERHAFERKKEGKRTIPDVTCQCGGQMEFAGKRVRDITEIKIMAEETRHIIEVARCACGLTVEAPHDLPAKGNFGRQFVGLVCELRAQRTPLAGIVETVRAATGVKTSESTINNIVARTSDALEPEAERIHRIVESSDVVGFDETGWNDEGRTAWANVAQTKDAVAMNISGSRATLMLDTMDNFKGIAITDGCGAYKRFDEDGRRQSCWAHTLRETKHLAKKYPSSTPPETKRIRQELHGDHKLMYHHAKQLASHDAHSLRQRHKMELLMQDLIDRYRQKGTDDPDMIKILDKLERQVPCMFTFLEHPGVDPTNNASETALRYLVVFRKTIGQTKGGARSMKRMADFVTCVLTWRRHGRSVFEEVARLI